MIDIFLQSIRSIGSFTEDEIDTVRNALSPKFYKKGTLLLDQGEVCSCFWFLETGSVYSYFFNAALDQQTTGLYVRGSWLVDQASFTARAPSKYKIAAFEDTETLILNIHDLHDLIGRSPVFFQLGKILGNPEHDAFRKERGPDERYLQLLNNQPQLLQTFPLKYIASYLGMTPETLSRVRKRISDIS
ncbi:MAG: Crp/Fnr family transcriptional regulator [Cytophagales bacterium]|nr:Crp/Fnr family transcriptional regulator [Cytophagales bacterium]